MVELAFKFEREFCFEISDDAAESILTVGDAVKFLEKNAVALNYKGDTYAAGAARKNA
jgi:hypothetical protein